MFKSYFHVLKPPQNGFGGVVLLEERRSCAWSRVCTFDDIDEDAREDENEEREKACVEKSEDHGGGKGGYRGIALGMQVM